MLSIGFEEKQFGETATLIWEYTDNFFLIQFGILLFSKVEVVCPALDSTALLDLSSWLCFYYQTLILPLLWSLNPI